MDLPYVYTSIVPIPNVFNFEKNGECHAAGGKASHAKPIRTFLIAMVLLCSIDIRASKFIVKKEAAAIDPVIVYS
jgi:hypothetical protein